MTTREADAYLLDEYTRDLYALRAWMLAQMRGGYAKVDRQNLDASFALLIPFLTGVTQVGIARAQEITDFYLATFAAMRGIDYSVGGGVRLPVLYTEAESAPLNPVFQRLERLRGPARPTGYRPQTVVGRPDISAPWGVKRYADRVQVLTSGRPTRVGFDKAPIGVKAAIKRGESVEEALQRSQGVSTTIIGSEAHRAARDMSAFQIIDPASPFTRWRRVPSPGACGFCIILATRGAVYRNPEVARRGHANCRCVVEAAGIEGAGWSAIDPADMLRTVSMRGANKARYTYNLATGEAAVEYPSGQTYISDPTPAGVGSSNMPELRPPLAFWENRARNRER